MDRPIPSKFTGNILGAPTPVTNEISKARLSIFYRGKNRNGTFITDEFAQSLLTTLPYAPVVGIFSEEEQDFLGHSYDSSEARIYGVVPENPQLSWETMMDPDGVSRVYCVCDVYLYTGRLEEARKIIGKSHSLELDPQTIEGHWELIDGEPFFTYSKAEFLGLSVLGDKVQPCFEGSSFFSLVKNFSNYMYSKNANGGIHEMDLDNKSIDNTVEDTTNDNIVVEDSAQNVQVDSPVDESNAEDAGEKVVDSTAEEDGAAETREEDEQPVREDPALESDEDSADQTNKESASLEDDNKKSITLTVDEFQAYEHLMSDYGSLIAACEKFETLNQEFLDSQNAANTFKAEAQTNLENYNALKEKVESFENSQKEEICNKYQNFVSPEFYQNLFANVAQYSAKELEQEFLYEAKDSLINLTNDSAPASFNHANNLDEDAVEAELRKVVERKN